MFMFIYKNRNYFEWQETRIQGAITRQQTTGYTRMVVLILEKYHTRIQIIGQGPRIFNENKIVGLLEEKIGKYKRVVKELILKGKMVTGMDKRGVETNTGI